MTVWWNWSTYVNLRERGFKIEGCQEGFKYTAVYSNGELRRRNLDGVLYADDVCLFAESAESLQRICDNVSAVIDEYGLNVNEIETGLYKWCE